MGCWLCNLVKSGQWGSKIFWQDEICTLTDCRICGRPMVIYNKHDHPSRKDINHMLKIKDDFYGSAPITTSPGRDHWGFHIETKWWEGTYSDF